MSRETFPTAHRKVDRIEINIKVLYRLAIFVIIIETLMFAIVVMRVHRQNTLAARSIAKQRRALISPTRCRRSLYLKK